MGPPRRQALRGRFRDVSDLLARIAPLSNPTRLTLTPVDCARPSGAKMKGFGLLHLLDVIAETHGETAVAAWRATVPELQRREVERRALTSVGWIPMEYYFHAITWVTGTFHQGDLRQAIVLGHEVTRRDIGTLFRKAMSFASPFTVLKLSGRFWRGYFDQSKLVVRSTSKTSVVADVLEWPLQDAASLHELVGALACWMETTDARDVRLTRFELTAPGTVRLEASWS